LHPRTEAVGSGEEGKLRLLREAKALARLSHPNVVAIHDVGTFGDCIFLAMEFVDGQTLGTWLKARPRPWKECVEILIKAGEGLAAAHRAGLIHRDFKPENVVIGHDGRVRVLDFGLARASDDLAESVGVASLGIEASTSIKVDITTTGVLVGTPAYMSPEQHLGRAADARSDLFAFCVALYQALYGERPFEGTNLSVLAANVIQGKIRPAPAGVKVPTWLHKLVLQGLSVDPKARFASMEVLLEHLRHDPLRIRMRWLGVVAVSALGIGIAVGTLGGKVEPPCQGAERRLAGIWDTGRKEAIKAAFVATGLPYAVPAWQSTERALDAYSKHWVTMHTEACEATQVRREQSEEMLDLRMLCLARQRGELEALTDVFVEATPKVVENALEGVGRLPIVASCGDLQALRERIPPPTDPAVRERVGRIRGHLAEAKALDIAGKWVQALGLAKSALEESVEVAYPPLEADALLVVAAIQQQLGEYDEVMKSLLRAAKTAAGSRYDEAVAIAWIETIYVAGIRLASYDRALWAGQAADVGIRRVEGAAADSGGPRAVLRARLDLNLARVHHRMKSDEAVEEAKRALGVFEKELGEAHPLVHQSLTVLALAALDRHQLGEAQRHFDRALAIARRVSGSEHPSVAGVLNNYAELELRRNKVEDALRLAREALTIREQVLASDHADLAKSYEQIARIEYRLGHFEDAQKNYSRALEIYDKHPTANAPYRGTCHNGRAMVALRQQQRKAAMEDFRAAMEAFRGAYGADHANTAIAEMNLGEMMIEEGQIDAGLEHVEAAIEFLRAAKSSDDYLAYALVVAGSSRLDSGQYQAAELRLREALTIYSRLEGVSNQELATVRFAMARTLMALGHSDEALALAAQAVDGLQGERELPIKKEIKAWIVASR
ncbi:MAG TPA: tetratricopeptide repeat protein, partial [Nannocystis exedens]|nr:tetratricopeptide repeat protein [Nannocystis exedens]